MAADDEDAANSSVVAWQASLAATWTIEYISASSSRVNGSPVRCQRSASSVYRRPICRMMASALSVFRRACEDSGRFGDLTVAVNISAAQLRLTTFLSQLQAVVQDTRVDPTRIELEITVAGQMFHQNFAAQPNQSYTFVWDGEDAFGRTVQGTQSVKVRIGYVYGAVYQTPAALRQSFGYNRNGNIAGNTARISWANSTEPGQSRNV